MYNSKRSISNFIYQQLLTQSSTTTTRRISSSHSLPTRGTRLITQTPECDDDVVYTHQSSENDKIHCFIHYFQNTRLEKLISRVKSTYTSATVHLYYFFYYLHAHIYHQVAQLSLTNPRDALHHDKRQNVKSHMTITTSLCG